MPAMQDIGEILYDKSMRNETRRIQTNQDAVFDVCEKMSDKNLDHLVRFILPILFRRR